VRDATFEQVDHAEHADDHVRNKPVFREHIRRHARTDDTPFLLWYDGRLGVEGSEPSCFEVCYGAWTTFEAAMTNAHPWWLSFDNDKILFAPKVESALVAFHHDCFEVAGIREDPDRLWQEMSG